MNGHYKRENNQEVGFLLKVYNPVYDFWTETEMPLRKTEPKRPSTKIHPAEGLLLLVVITPLDLADHQNSRLMHLQ